MKKQNVLKNLNFKKETIIRLTDLDRVKGKGDVIEQSARFTCGGDRPDCFGPPPITLTGCV